MLQKWLRWYDTQSTESLPYEFNRTRAGKEVRSISARFIEFTINQIIRWIPIFNEWNFVRTIFHENINTYTQNNKRKTIKLNGK